MRNLFSSVSIVVAKAGLDHVSPDLNTYNGSSHLGLSLEKSCTLATSPHGPSASTVEKEKEMMALPSHP